MSYAISTVRWTILAAAAVTALAGVRASAQLDLGALNPAGQGTVLGDQAPVTVEARIAPAEGGRPAYLVVTADVAEGWHIYSLTQKRGGPVPSKITVEPSPGFKLSGDFTPNLPPDVHPEPAFDNLPVEAHEGQVVWSAPVELSAGVDPAKLAIVGKFAYQACDASSCLPPKSLSFTATLGAPLPADKPAAAGKASDYRLATAHVVLRGYVDPQGTVPGGKARLVITAEPTEGYHVYAWAERDPQKGSKPTLVRVNDPAGWKASAPVADGKLLESDSVLAPGEKDRYYEQPVTWTIELSVPADAKSGEAKLAGVIGFQTCREDKGCDFPQAAEFKATLPVGGQTIDGRVPLVFSPAKNYKQAAEGVSAITDLQGSVLDIGALRPDTPKAGDQSLLVMMGFGFLGGLILNLMPCVLPVIGLKILSFVEQSGQHRRQVFLLNVWYSAGILAVFMVLATLPVAYHFFQDKQFGWGQQFAYDGFNITLTAIVFVMALSFLGVWEIPIPGFASGSKANEMAAKEGVAGAFAKGALTTVLATPCSGPFLGTALAFALAEPPYITYAMFGCIGLGMAFPYLLIGAFPRLIRFLPKPGPWMDTFKQVMGFVLLGTVVYLMTVIQWAAVVPTLALLIGLWAGCWWIGRTPGYAEFGSKMRAWAGGAAAASVVAIVAFQWLGPIMADRFQLTIDRQVEKQIRSIAQAGDVPGPKQQANDRVELPWEPYSIAKLQQLTAAGKTVMLDFTADWCQTCKALEKFVLNTRDTREAVEANGIVPLVVDMTRFPPEEASLLEKLSGGQSVPVLAIFPAGRPNEPIVLSNGYTKGLLLEKLRQAGPSKGASPLTALKTPR